MTSRTGNTPSCRATAGEKCTETVGRMKSGSHFKSSTLALLAVVEEYIKAASVLLSLLGVGCYKSAVCLQM